MTGTSPDQAQKVRIPPTVWALGFVSLFTDISSEIIHGLLPLFLTTTLGASVAMVGLIDGIAESTASISKIFSGYISDRLGRRKPLILLGYGLGAFAKPFFALASSAGLVLGARFVDRIGKGLRDAPRDALISDVTPVPIRGRAFGLRQSLDTVGAVLGPLLAVGLMILFANDMRAVFWVAVIPALISVTIALLGVRDRSQSQGEEVPQVPLKLAELKQLDRSFWLVVITGVIFALARFSEGFLVLRAHENGLPIAMAPFVLVGMNVIYAAGAYPAGILSDCVKAKHLLVAGLVCLLLADICLAYAAGLVGVFAGIALWGAHLALTQGLLAKLVADRAPEHLRGSAFGMFNLASGLAMLGASVIAGLLWDELGSRATFLAGALFAGGTLLMIAVVIYFERQRGRLPISE